MTAEPDPDEHILMTDASKIIRLSAALLRVFEVSPIISIHSRILPSLNFFASAL